MDMMVRCCSLTMQASMRMIGESVWPSRGEVAAMEDGIDVCVGTPPGDGRTTVFKGWGASARVTTDAAARAPLELMRSHQKINEWGYRNGRFERSL
jgi:hypothetical protein